MIQELRSILLNDINASKFVLMPSDFVALPLSNVESQIRESIFDNTNSSIEYRAYIASKIVSAIYRENEFQKILSDAFDTRNNYQQDNSNAIKYISWSAKNYPENVLIDVSKATENTKTNVFNYNLRVENVYPDRKALIISGGHNNIEESFILSSEEESNGTKWKTISETNVFIKVQSIDYANGETISIHMPFVFNAKKILDSLLSIQGLIDRLALVSEIYPEIDQKFNSESRIDRRLFAIVIAYGILVKNQMK